MVQPNNLIHSTFQAYYSAETSVNSKQLPAIYNRINWRKLRQDVSKPASVLDIGAGKHIIHIQSFLSDQFFRYYPHDPYNLPDEINKLALSIKPSVVICSNVFNVIEEDAIIRELHEKIRSYNVPFFITVYEGDRSYIGTATQGGHSFQRNTPTGDYLLRWDEIVYKKTITLPVYRKYLTTEK